MVLITHQVWLISLELCKLGQQLMQGPVTQLHSLKQITI